MDEMVSAIKGLKYGKEPGGDEIPAEVWKYGGTNLSNILHRWIIKIWEEGYVPQAWKDANIIYKKRANVVISEVYLFFLQPEGGAREAVRLSFRPKHSRHDLLPMTTPGRCIEQDRPLYNVFVDFTNVFNTVGGLDCGSC